MAASPWRRAFALARFLPRAVLGPVLFAELRRLALIFFLEILIWVPVKG